MSPRHHTGTHYWSKTQRGNRTRTWYCIYSKIHVRNHVKNFENSLHKTCNSTKNILVPTGNLRKIFEREGRKYDQNPYSKMLFRNQPRLHERFSCRKFSRIDMVAKTNYCLTGIKLRGTVHL